MIPRAIRFRLSGFPRIQGTRPSSSISGPSRISQTRRTSILGSRHRDAGQADSGLGQPSRSPSPPSLHGLPSPFASPSNRPMHTLAQPVEPPPRTHGRRRRRALLLAAREQARKSPIHSELHSRRIVPLPTGTSPIFTSPVQSAMHVAHTPSHLPLPIPLGTEMYDLQSVLHPSSIYGTELPWTVFGSTARPMWTDPSTDSMAESMSEGLTSSESGTSVLAEHLAVMDLVDPGHHLGSEEMHEDGEYTSFESMMRDREVRNSLESQAEWEELLAKMGHKSGSSQGGSRAQDLSTLNEGQALEVKDAISDLFTTLRRIDATPRSQRTREARQVDVLDHDGQYVEITNDDGGSDVVLLRTGQNGERRYKLLGEDGEAQDYEMLSTVRKRRKKIKKHKYKKRRKDQRSLRKRLGK